MTSLRTASPPDRLVKITPFRHAGGVVPVAGPAVALEGIPAVFRNNAVIAQPENEG